MNTADNTSPALTLAQEFSQLISKITSKELDFFTDENIEILHDLRVDLRKLRTWLKIIEMNGYCILKLYKHTLYCHNLGSELRNFDVLIHWMQTSPVSFSPKLYHALEHERKNLKKDFLKELIHKNSLQKLEILGRDIVSGLKGVTKEDFKPYTVRYIDKKRKEFTSMLSHVSGEIKQLHEMRKVLKKARYALPLLPAKYPQHQHSLKHLQEMLGYINDRRVWLRLIQKHLKKEKDASALQTVLTGEMKEKIEEFKTYISSEKVLF